MNKLAPDKQKIKLLKQELADAQRGIVKAATLFSSIGQGVIVTDQYGRIEQINELSLDILGYRRRDMLGKRFVEVIRAVNEDGTLIDPIDRPITRAFLMGMPITERTHYLTSGNTIIPVDITIAPVMNDGEPTGAIEVFRDLTDDYVKEKIQSDFISIASHQLRTPLSSIYTYSQMLAQGYAGKLTAKQANFVAVIEGSANRMNELIHSLLNVTRLEAGNISVNVQPINVDQLCGELVRSLEPLASDKGILIDYLNADTDSVATDGLLLSEILSNLVSNAIKYTPEGGYIRLKVETKEQVIFSVKDNGYGIPPKEKKYVFAKFYRADNAVHNDVSGTGIGLYLAHELANRLDGNLWFKSDVGKGSTFYFSLPLVGSATKQGKFSLEMPG